MFGLVGLEPTWELFSVMLLDYFGVFGWISGKMDEISKSAQFRGPTLRLREPTQQRRSTPRHGMSTPRHGREEAWKSLGYTKV